MICGPLAVVNDTFSQKAGCGALGAIATKVKVLAEEPSVCGVKLVEKYVPDGPTLTTNGVGLPMVIVTVMLTVAERA